jgi:hypothetical protein
MSTIVYRISVLWGAILVEVPVGSVTAHLPKGVHGHRRQQGVSTFPANSRRQLRTRLCLLSPLRTTVRGLLLS